MKPRFAIFLLATVALLWACTAGGGSIYYTLENETKTTDNTLKNDIPIHDIALHGDGNYYATGGRIWRGTPASGTVTWDTTTPITPPVDGALCTALVAFGSDLYGGFITQSGALGLYKASGSPPSFSGAGGQITDASVKDRQVALLAIVKSLTVPELVVSTAIAGGDPYTYDLLLSTNGSSYSSLLAATTTKPFTGVAYTSASGGKYWAVSGSSLYSGTGTADLVPVTSPTGATSTEVLTSVFSDDENLHLFVTSNLGFVYYLADAATTSWARNATAEKVGDATVKFLAVAGGSGSGKMLVGSDGSGYYVLTVADPPTLARFTGSTIGLYTASVRKFLIDGTRLFACTNGKGLWRGESFNPSDCVVGTWSQE